MYSAFLIMNVNNDLETFNIDKCVVLQYKASVNETGLDMSLMLSLINSMELLVVKVL